MLPVHGLHPSMQLPTFFPHILASVGRKGYCSPSRFPIKQNCRKNPKRIFHMQSTYDQHHPIPLVKTVVIISLLVLILIFPLYLCVAFPLHCYLGFFLSSISCSTLLLPLLPSVFTMQLLMQAKKPNSIGRVLQTGGKDRITGCTYSCRIPALPVSKQQANKSCAARQSKNDAGPKAPTPTLLTLN